VVEYAFHKDEDGNVVRTKIDKALRRFLKMFEMIETAVSNGYFGINSFSMVDCFVAPILTATNMWPEGEEATLNSIPIRDYLSQMSERQNFKNTVP
jgi:glutathione S-transferase